MRRWFTIVVSCLLCLLVAPAPNALALNPIQLENEQPGTTAWELPGATPTTIPDPSTAIEGYASQISVAPGDTLALHVATAAAAQYRVEIYRLGWYGGTGGRLVACVPDCTGSEPGAPQATAAPDPNTGELDAGWPVTDTVAITPSWVSGYYLAKFVLVSGPAQGQASELPFIVRAPPGSNTAILVQASVNTWEAYNNWGGKSLYAYNSSGATVPASGTTAAAMVSFNRPFAVNWNTTPLTWEYGLVRYLERRGYDVSYQTDADTDQSPSTLLGHRLDIVNGHDEYWSPAMRNAWEAARGAAVNEVFMGGDIGYWQARYAGGHQTLVEYRQASLDPEPDPQLKTVQFQNLSPPRPECSLLGANSSGGLAKAGDPPRSFTVTPAAASNPWFAGTGLTPGATIADSVGYEWDTFQPACAPSSAQVLMHWSGKPANADAVTYTAPSGAQIFSDDTMQLTWALDDFGHTPHADSRVQTLFAHMFDTLGAAPAGTAPPVTSSLSPGPGVWTAARVSFRWAPHAPGPESFTVTVDGRNVGTLRGSACTALVCSLTARLRPGLHTWQVLATNPLGGEASGAARVLRVDATAPAGFALRSPARAARLWNPRPRLRWRRSSDRGSGLAGYDVLIDGRQVAFTRATSYTPPTALSDGRHSWQIIAVDRVGNQRRSHARFLRIASARLAPATHALILAHGLTVFSYCPHRCSVSATVRIGPRTVAAASTQHFSRGGVRRVMVPMPAALRRRLSSGHHVRLTIVVITASGRARRAVDLTLRW